jgi:hypothetical protein
VDVVGGVRDADARRTAQRQLFQPSNLRVPAWEPPADVLETEREVLVIVSLPGVNIDAVEVATEDGALAIGGVRALPLALRHAVIHRLESVDDAISAGLEDKPDAQAA